MFSLVLVPLWQILSIAAGDETFSTKTDHKIPLNLCETVVENQEWHTWREMNIWDYIQ